MEPNTDYVCHKVSAKTTKLTHLLDHILATCEQNTSVRTWSGLYCEMILWSFTVPTVTTLTASWQNGSDATKLLCLFTSDLQCSSPSELPDKTSLHLSGFTSWPLHDGLASADYWPVGCERYPAHCRLRYGRSIKCSCATATTPHLSPTIFCLRSS